MNRQKRLLSTLVLACSSLLACQAHITNRDDRRARVHHDLGVAAFEAGRVHEAFKELERALSLHPKLPETHQAMGLVLHTLGRVEASRHHYERALELRPTYSAAANNLGVLLLDTGDYAAAAAAFQHALTNPRYATPASAEGNLGWAYFKMGQADEARRHILRALERNPTFCRGYGWLAEIDLAHGRPDHTVEHIKQFSDRCLRDPRVSALITPQYRQQMAFFLGQAYLHQGDAEAAEEAFARCTAHAKDDNPGVESYTERCRVALLRLE